MPNKSYVNYKNRGMFLEHILNDTNQYYLREDKAIIYKKPTPIKVLNVSYRSRKTTIINKAVFSETSTLDYNGIYKGKYIEFDAKECKSKTSFPLSNIKEHQMIHIKNILNHGGIVFLIIFICNNFYLFDGKDLIDFANNNDRKSIPIETIIKQGHIINEGYIPRLDYISVVENVYFKENNYGEFEK